MSDEEEKTYAQHIFSAEAESPFTDGAHASATSERVDRCADCGKELGSSSSQAQRRAHLMPHNWVCRRCGIMRLSPEHRSEMSRRGHAALTPEQRSERVRVGNTKKAPEHHADHCRKMRSIFASMPPERHRDAASKANAAQTPEARSDRSRKAWATRRAKSAQVAP